MYRVDRTEATGGRTNELDNLFETSSRYGAAIGSLLKPYLSQGLIVDVGSSTGGVLTGIKKTLPEVSVLGIEPSPDEAKYAEVHGIKTVVSLFEDFKSPLPKALAAIICTQSLNHLLDPKGFLDRSHEMLQNGGYLLLAVKNFRHQSARAGSTKGAIQIDHPFMFTPEVLKRFVEQSGFTVVYFDVDEKKSKREIDIQRMEGLTKGHIRLIARKSVKPGRVSFVPFLTRLKLRIQFLPIVTKGVYLLKHSQRLSLLR
ncbi:MAG: class I SAM-dependent methyltransferase [bacterium]|nr:class I SAM-dependent methyltransferase [bacterium]